MLTVALLFSATSGLALPAPNKAKPTYKDIINNTPCPAPKVLKDGFYVGVQGGYDVYDVHENYSPVITGLTGNTNTRNAGWVGGLFVGYGRDVLESFYIGTEILGNYNGSSTSYQFTSSLLGNYASKFTTKGSFGVSLIPGVKITNVTLGYVRIGYNWVNLQTQENNSTTGFSARKNATSSGFNYGLGAETLLYKSLSLRGEYTYTNYSNFNTSMGTNFSPADNQFMLSLIYHIG
jgi:opacity protein-like surface antigen